MSIEELIRGYGSSEGAVALTVLLALGLWAARRFGLVKQLTTSQEVATVLPAAVAHVLASMHAGKSWKESLILGALVFVGPMKWNSPPLPAKGSSTGISSPPTAASLLLIAALALPGCSQLLGTLVQLGNTSHLVSSYLELIDDGANVWVAAHPDDLEGAQKLKGAIDRTRRALLALEKLGTSAEAYEAGDVAAAKLELLEAYTALYEVAQQLGLLPSRQPRTVALRLDGARQVEAITPAELEVLLQ